MRKRPVLLAIGCGALAAVVWWRSRERPADVPAAPPPVGRILEPPPADPTASATTADALSAPLPAPRRAASRATVRGRIGGERVWFVALTVDTAGEPVRVATAVDGSFAAPCPAPLTALRVEVSDAEGPVLRTERRRDAALAGDDWQLGTIEIAVASQPLRLELFAEPEVATALVRSSQDTVHVAVHAARENGPVLVEHAFALRDAAPGAALQHDGEVEVPAERPLFAEWRLAAGRAPSFRRSDAIDRVGGRAHAALSLTRADVVLGRLVWADGTPSAGESLTCEVDAEVGALWQCTTAADGSFCFVLGAGGRGRVGLPGLAQLRAAGADPPVPVVAGQSVTLSRSAAPVRFRLLDARGAPLAGWRAASGTTMAAPAAREPGDGVQLLPDDVLRETPWLDFALADGARGLFRVPADWLASRGATAHDVRVADFEPTGTVLIERDGDGEAWPAGLQITLHAEGALRGWSYTRSAPASGPWTIDHVPLGDYRYETLQWRSPRWRNGGALTLPASGRARVVLRE